MTGLPRVHRRWRGLSTDQAKKDYRGEPDLVGKGQTLRVAPSHLLASAFKFLTSR
jgi:hypothetical protein